MSSSSRNGTEHIKRVLDRAEAAGISLELGPTGFSDKLLSAIKISPDQHPLVRNLVSALEATLNRSHDDARLILSLCSSLHEYTGLTMPILLKHIEKAIKHLDKPVAAAVIRTIRNSSATALHPKVIDVRDLDAIAALSKAPIEAISSLGEDLLRVGKGEINLTSSGKKEIEAAVKKAKADHKKSSDGAARRLHSHTQIPLSEEQEIDATPALGTPDLGTGDSVDFELSEDLTTEIDVAVVALARLLRSMPKTGKLSALTLAIEEAQKILEFTRRDLGYPRHQEQTSDPMYGDLN